MSAQKKKSYRNKKNNKIYYSFITAGLGIIVVLLFILNPQLFDNILGYFSDNGEPVIVEGEAVFHYIDIGQGDSELIVMPDGSTMLIDAGPNSNENDLMNYLDSQKITHLTYFVLTHPHEDHIGGADLVLNKIKVDTVLMPDITHDTVTFEKVLSAIDKNGSEVIIPKSGEVYKLGEASFKILGPAGSGYSSLNNWSIVLNFNYGNTSFLFTGDCEKLSEKEILNKFPANEFKCNVLKIGHHGSSSSTSQELLEAAKAEYAVISCATGNTYGHPHRETIDILTKNNIKILRTDLEKTIVFISDGVNIRLSE